MLVTEDIASRYQRARRGGLLWCMDSVLYVLLAFVDLGLLGFGHGTPSLSAQSNLRMFMHASALTYQAKNRTSGSAIEESLYECCSMGE
jgi:hypothetical protein